MDMDSKLVGQDVPKFSGLVSGMTERVKEVREHVSKVKEHIESEDYNPEAGISLLELKFQLLLSYLVNLVQMMVIKTSGQSISDSPPVHRLVEIRTVLERIRPLDQKLKYQVDKLMRTASTGMASASDPLRFKPNPSNLVSKLEDNVSSDDADGGSHDPKVYVPPKALSVPFHEKPVKSGHKPRLRTAFMDELKEEVLDMPSEVKTSVIVGGSKKRKELAQEKELEQFEESHMMRMSRKRLSNDTGRSNRQEIDDLTDFSEFRSITHEAGEFKSDKKAKRIKSSSAKNKKRYKKRRK